MKKKSGIFVPLRAAVCYDANSDYVPLDMAEEELQTKIDLAKAHINADVNQCVVYDEKQQLYFGLLIRPHQENQMTYAKAWELIYPYRFGFENYYTVPNLYNVISAGVGYVTHSVYMAGKDLSLETISNISAEYRKQCNLPLRLIFISNKNGENEILGVSPLSDVGNPASVWQNYLSKALKKVLPQNVKYFFYQSWSTNDDLIDKLSGR